MARGGGGEKDVGFVSSTITDFMSVRILFGTFVSRKREKA